MAKFKTVEEYISGLNPVQAEIARALRAAVRKAVPEAAESIKWAQPVYEVNGPICAIKAHSKHVNIVFWRGQELRPLCPQIEGEGEKMGHLKISTLFQIDAKQLGRMCKEGARLNVLKGNPNARR